ncbi:MAG: hypothetical protein IRZ15_12495 [Bryobacteraceae bacterium]|jgi:hypothetical protein|nr:hypothetical protein [Bryobacteraceae bacterium]
MKRLFRQVLRPHQSPELEVLRILFFALAANLVEVNDERWEVLRKEPL